jgi:hypothetical protein
MKTQTQHTNYIQRSLRRSALLFVSLMLGCFDPAPTVQAVIPPPDGGYPAGNTPEGQSALISLTSGRYDTAVGLFSLLSDTEGSFNTAVGAGPFWPTSVPITQPLAQARF